MSKSAFNDDGRAIITFGILVVVRPAAATFSLAASLLDLVTRCAIGIVAGQSVLGYLAALVDRACRRSGVPRGEPPVVTLVAVIGAYFAADGATFRWLHGGLRVAGIMLGNSSETFGFKIVKTAKRKSLTNSILTTAFILRLFIFIAARRPGDRNLKFPALMNQYWFGARSPSSPC